jgi:hypothetical protein
MLKTENPIIFTCFEDNSYFSSFKQQKSFVYCCWKRVNNLCWCFYVHNFYIFSVFCVCKFFYFLIFSTHLQQNCALLQMTICLCQMNYKIPLQQCQLFKLWLRRQQKSLHKEFYLLIWSQWSKYAKFEHATQYLTYQTININRQWKFLKMGILRQT